MRPLISFLLFAVFAQSSLAASEARHSTDLQRMQITLPAGDWQIEANGKDDEGDPEFEANWRDRIELDLGEVSSVPLITGEADAMLDHYEATMSSFFHELGKQARLPKNLRLPTAFTCRAYRSVLFKGDAADGTDLVCYAPYRGGARTMMIAIEDQAEAADWQALQDALDALKLVE